MDDIKKFSVLIIDDDSQTIKALSLILGSDYTIYIDINGQDAIESAEIFVPDVILLDILMPKMDGYEVIKTLKKSEKTKNIPIIIISGLTDEDSKEKGFALGAVDYITKPFSITEIKQKVEKQIEQRK